MDTLDSRFEKLLILRDRIIEAVMRFGLSRTDSEDVVQQTYMKVRKHLAGVHPAADWTYLLNAARRHALNFRMRTRTHTPLEDAPAAALRDRVESPETALIKRQEKERFRAAFNAAMAELPEDTRRCLILRRQGYSYKQIGETLGLSWTAVQSRLYRASEHFRKRVAPPPPDVQWLEIIGDSDGDDETGLG